MPLINTTEPKHASESQHWYTSDGVPMYTIIGKNGKERNTTLRDARKLNFKPSVTMIAGQAAKPGLEHWKIDQHILAVLTMPKIEGESESDYITRIKADAKEQAIKAAERGIWIHACIQAGFDREFDNIILTEEAEIYWLCAVDEIQKHTGHQQWEVETPFANDRYGGKVDLHCQDYVIDIKTKDTTLDDVKTWDEHHMQIAAYRHGLGLTRAKGGILFVSTKTVAAKLVWITEEELQRGLKMFNALTDFYYAKTGL